ncbi:MAG: helix-turn-helix domain-containing protein [Ktedonobacterales bacterium]|jgi:transcriptional regulator with XRE-family HTH domain
MDASAHDPRSAAQELDISWSDFGPFLKRLRMRRGLSQERLAERLGCDRTYIWRLEHSRNHPSRIFLHDLEQTIVLTAQEAAALARFMSLRAYSTDEALGQ